MVSFICLNKTNEIKAPINQQRLLKNDNTVPSCCNIIVILRIGLASIAELIQHTNKKYKKEAEIRMSGKRDETNTFGPVELKWN